MLLNESVGWLSFCSQGSGFVRDDFAGPKTWVQGTIGVAAVSPKENWAGTLPLGRWDTHL